MVLRLGVYVQGKLEVDRLGSQGLLDRASGLYNGEGIARRSAELAALTARQGLPLACAVFQPPTASSPSVARTGSRRRSNAPDASRMPSAAPAPRSSRLCTGDG